EGLSREHAYPCPGDGPGTVPRVPHRDDPRHGRDGGRPGARPLHVLAAASTACPEGRRHPPPWRGEGPSRRRSRAGPPAGVLGGGADRRRVVGLGRRSDPFVGRGVHDPSPRGDVHDQPRGPAGGPAPDASRAGVRDHQRRRDGHRGHAGVRLGVAGERQTGGDEAGARFTTAYELAVVQGFDGTLDEWLDSLIGPGNVLSVDQVDTGAPGSDAAVTISGNSPKQALSFTIPRGDRGATGPANVLTVGEVVT